MSMFSRLFHSVANVVEKSPLAGVINTGITGIATGLGGPVGGAVASLGVQALVNDAQSSDASVPQLPSLPPVAAAGGSAAAGGTGSAIMGAASAAGGILKNAAGKITGFILKDGSHLSLAGAARIVTRFGPAVLATAIGIGVEQLVTAIFGHHKSHRRRGRGITAGDIRATRRTIKRIERLHSQLAHLARSSVHHSARRGFGGGRSVQVVRAG